MGVVDRHVGVPTQTPGLSPQVLNVGDMYVFGFPLASNTAGVYTTNSLVSNSVPFNNTLAIGTQPDIARCLAYRLSLTNGTASSAMVTAGTIYINGSDIFGQSCSESIAMTGLASNSVHQVGSVAFASLSASFSVSNFALHTASSSASASVTLAIGFLNQFGIPGDVRGGNLTQNLTGTATVAVSGTTTPFPYMWNATSKFTNYTIGTGNVPFSNISVGPTMGSGSMLYGMHMWSR